MEIDGIQIPDSISAQGDGMISAYVMSEKNKPTPADPTPPAPADSGQPVPPVPADSGQPVPPAPADPTPPSSTTIDMKEYLSLKEKYEELEKKAKTPVFEGEFDADYFRLGIMAKKDPDKFEALKQLKLNPEIDPVRLLVYDHISKNPEFKGRESDVENFIKRQYQLNVRIPLPLSPDDYSEEEVRERELEINEANEQLKFAKTNLELAAKKVKSELETEFNAIDLPKNKVVSEEERVAAVSKAKTEWAPVVTKMMEVLTHIPLMSQKADSEAPVEILKYEIPVDLKVKYASQLVNYLSENNLPMTEESVQRAAAMFINTFKQENEARINHALARKIRSMTDAEYAIAYSNPSAVRDQHQPPATQLSLKEQGERAAAEAAGYKFNN